MSHVDDGVLHAFLDGAYEEGDTEREALEAHLATCADCRVRLEDARRIKQRAHSALGRLAPESIAVPAFDTVVAERAARSRAGAGSSTSVRRPWMPMAWAASVMLAIGAGWMANQLFDASRVPAPLEQARTSAPAEGQDAPATQMLDQVVAPASTVNEARERDARAAQPETAAGASNRPTAEDLPAAPPTPPAAADAAGRRVDSMMSADLTRKTEPSTIRIVNGAQRSLEMFRSGVDSLRLGFARQEAAAPVDPVDALLRDYAEATATGQWRTVSATEAMMRLSRAPAALDSIVPDSVDLAEIEGRTLVRVTHMIDDSVRIEIVQRAAPGLAMQGRIAGAGRGGRGGGSLGQQGQSALLRDFRANEERAPLRTYDGVRVLPVTVAGLPGVIVLVNAPEDQARDLATRVR